MKYTLAENMRRFNTKNLTESNHPNIGDLITINPAEFPDFEFPKGTQGKIIDIDKADYASDDLVYTIEIYHIDSLGYPTTTLHVEKPYQMDSDSNNNGYPDTTEG